MQNRRLHNFQKQANGLKDWMKENGIMWIDFPIPVKVKTNSIFNHNFNPVESEVSAISLETDKRKCPRYCLNLHSPDPKRPYVCISDMFDGNDFCELKKCAIIRYNQLLNQCSTKK